MKQFDLGAVTAYAIAVENGFKGTKQEWLDSLKGGVNVPFAQPGQLIIVKSVDEDGKPTEWEPVDRTHWTEGGMVEILPECQPTATDGMLYITEPLNGEVVVGNAYTVKWNGTEYQTIAKEMTEDGMTAQVLGDLYTASDGAIGTEATGEPFVILVFPAEIATEEGIYAQIIPFDGSTSLTLSISQPGETIHKLDNKYLDLDWLPTSGTSYIEILPETTMTPATDIDPPGGLALKPIGLVAGETYIVSWNGAEYECKAAEYEVDSQPFVGIGDMSAYGVAPVTGEPFIMVDFLNPDGIGHMWGVLDGSTEVTLSVQHKAKVPNKLPEEYLPESVDSVILRSSTAGSTKLFKLTVDDSGTITATEVTE